MNTEGLSRRDTRRDASSLTPSHALCRRGLLSHKPEAPLSRFPSQPDPTHPKEQTLIGQTHRGCSGWSHLSGETESLSPISADKAAQALGASPPAGTPSQGKQREKL